MKKKIRKTEKLPKYGTVLRSKLVDAVATLPGYQEGIKKGLPLFTEKELDEIKRKYKKKKLTWEEIDKILSKKGVIFKKATFRKYIHDGNLSKAIAYAKTGTGRVALFPADTIAHINFIQYYYKILDGEQVDKIADLIQNQQITYADAIESRIDSNNTNLSETLVQYIVYLNDVIIDAIDKALESKPTDRDNLLKKLEDISIEYNKTIADKISGFKDLLTEKAITVSEAVVDGRETGKQRVLSEYRRTLNEDATR